MSANINPWYLTVQLHSLDWVYCVEASDDDLFLLLLLLFLQEQQQQQPLRSDIKVGYVNCSITLFLEIFPLTL